MLRVLNLKTVFKTLLIFFLVVNVSISFANPTPDISKTTITTSNSNFIASTDSNGSKQKDGLIKRNVKVPDLSAASSSATAKSYDPPAEFYRGSGTTSKISSATDSATASFVSKPVTFPDNTGHTKYNSNDLSQKVANTLNNWQQLHGQESAQERISVKHFGGGSDSHALSGGYAHGNGASHYIDYGAGGGANGGYYGGTQSGEIAGGIPFDVYGGKGSGQYAGAGGEYSYTYPEGGGHEPAVHKDYHNLTKKTLLAKSFLIPLASAAVLGIAAALVSHPWLLQLGAVSGTPLGATLLGKRRRRRDLASAELTSTTAASGQQQLADNDSSHLLAYRAHHPADQRLED